MQALKDRGALHLNSTHLVEGKAGGARQLLEKAHIYEAELMMQVRPQEYFFTHN
jgi:hypothetical protein